MLSAGIMDASATEVRLDVRVFVASRVSLPPGKWNHSRLDNTFWRLYQHDASGADLLLKGEAFPLEAERIYLIPPGLTLATRSLSPFRQFFLHFDLLGFPGVALRDLFPGPVQVPAAPPFEATVADLAAHLHPDWRTDPALECWIRGVLCEAIGRYLTAAPEERSLRYKLRLSALRPVLPALQHIHQHLSDRVTNADLAARCSLSEDHFIRQFRAAAGVPPAQYVTQRRIARAAELLLLTDQSIDRIAEQTGFRDRFYFSRVFARATGRPPAAFRRGEPG